MKTRAIGMVAGLALMGAVAAAAAVEISEALRLAVQSEVAAIEKETPQMGEVMAALREIGASYLPELVATADVDRYQGLVMRRIMTGIYLMDLTYASTFGRQADAARYGEAVYQLLDLVGYPQPEMERRYREALEQIDEPGGDARLRQLVKEQEQNKLWQDKLQTSEGVELAADNLYGFLLEGLYLTSELCFLANYDASSMMYVAYLRDSFQAYNRLLNLMGNSPEFAAWVEGHDRMNFLASVFVILGDQPVIAPAQLDALRPAIAKARNQIVR
ncbi:MAG: hypothetical protein AB7V22_04090 [Kiritimatiellia bacterium]